MTGLIKANYDKLFVWSHCQRVRLFSSLIALVERKHLKSPSWCKITAVLAQVADLKTRNQQLDSENTELSQRNSKSQADVQDLNQQLARVLKQKEREEGKCTLEEWEKERLLLKEELENSKMEVQDLVGQVDFRGFGIGIPVLRCAWDVKAELC